MEEEIAVIEGTGADEVSEELGGGELTPEQRLEQRIAQLEANHVQLSDNHKFLYGEIRGNQGKLDRLEAIAKQQDSLGERFASKDVEPLLEEFVKRFDDGAALWDKYKQGKEFAELKAQIKQEKQQAETAPEQKADQPDPTAREQARLNAQWRPLYLSLKKDYARMGVPTTVLDDALAKGLIKRANDPNAADYDPDDPDGVLAAYESGKKYGAQWKSKITAQTKERVNTDAGTRGSGSGNKNYGETAARDIPDDEFMSNFAEIARQKIAAQRR